MLILNSFSAFLKTTSTMVSFLPSSDSRSAIWAQVKETITGDQFGFFYSITQKKSENLKLKPQRNVLQLLHCSRPPSS